MAGAGGGGFLLAVVKDVASKDELIEIAKCCLENSQVFELEVDNEGIAFEVKHDACGSLK